MEAALITVFILGYIAIAFEHSLKIDKAASAVLCGVLCWVVFMMFSNISPDIVNADLKHHLASISEVVFFLLGAMTIVELIDSHEGFEIITTKISTLNKRKLLFIISFLSFILSAVLDNLTTAIVMVSLLRKMVADKNDRMLLCGMVVIAANAGGAWSPIGDVTTTMLWVGGQLSATAIISHLILPSIVCLLVPVFIISLTFKGRFARPENSIQTSAVQTTRAEKNIILFSGLFLLILVPVFKTYTHLPPYMGILFALGVLWVITEMLHQQKESDDKTVLSVSHALRKIDTPSILFFFGILAAVACLENAHILKNLSTWLDLTIGDRNIIIISTGLLSAVVDNVPLVAANMGMYEITNFPPDSYLWKFLAYSAGTGGSILIIGSAAGVATMGIEKIPFGWYLKKIGWLAFLGFIAGAGTFILQEYLLNAV